MTRDIPLESDDAEAEDRREALGYVSEAFAEALMAGLQGDSFAHAALFAAFQELVATYGEEPVADFAGKLPQRVRGGEFTIAQRH
jgi:hypothetical protein